MGESEATRSVATRASWSSVVVVDVDRATCRSGCTSAYQLTSHKACRRRFREPTVRFCARVRASRVLEKYLFITPSLPLVVCKRYVDGQASRPATHFCIAVTSLISNSHSSSSCLHTSLFSSSAPASRPLATTEKYKRICKRHTRTYTDHTMRILIHSNPP